MLRDFKFLRRKQNGVGEEVSDEIENVPTNPRDSLASQSSYDSLTRPPLNTINDPNPTSKPEMPDFGNRKTPTKQKVPPRTPTKSYHRFGWGQRGEELREEGREYGRVGLVTPRSMRNLGKANSGHSESNSTQSTPTKSVSKPLGSGIRGRVEGAGGGRVGNLHRGIPVSGGSSGTVVNSVEVPHFDLKEDPSFWMEHNVQVLIRIRPLNSMEKSSMYGYNRCLKQESAQSITWIGQPETRFTFDHVACETVDQEMLFRMVCLPMVENCLSGYNSCMFAYGQTGSGKTYTMLGEIDNLEVKPSPHRGMTPRIFEFLFARIQAEEESRRDERLKYNCKCSFLEIYNEQITDLLDPSSTNLLLREDAKKGVYVENLSEFEVQTVSDVLKLLTQGSLNRKVAATNMNRESSRSHSVFTCEIESRWENNATTNLRFARLNLVDLAGSERQKSSGAEGERLKEAANINKSLSILGHVIMILMDVAQGRPRHVPYRDSKLTFLLQDSLGGNSKTMIIANVSPSICCAAETLNTLKFAQRAKLIQNNAVVNEDSSGDVIALQHQIRLLKEELAVLKRQNVSRSLSFGSTARNSMQDQDIGCTKPMQEINEGTVDDWVGNDSKGIVRMSTKQWKSLEMTLAGALRREQMAEGSIKKLEAEIEHLNRLVRQREEDTRGTKMMLRFREDRIQRMESLVGSLLPPDTFLLEENKALTEEIQQLQAKMDKNPEVTRFALENIRLLEQLRRFQEFYEEGEREILLDEVSGLRDQLLQFLDGKSTLPKNSNSDGHAEVTAHIGQEDKSLHLELKGTMNELENCRNKLTTCLEENQKLSREIHDLHCMLDKLKHAANHQGGNIETEKDCLEAPTSEHGILDGDQDDFEGVRGTLRLKHAEKVLDLQLELDILKIILKEERSASAKVETNAMCMNHNLDVTRKNLQVVSKQYEDALNELKESKSVIEALESQQILAINEIEDLKKRNSRCEQTLGEKEVQLISLKEQLARKALRDTEASHLEDGRDSILQRKLRRMQDSLETAKRLNMWYQSDRALCESNEEEMDEVSRQAEAETAEVIVCMQEELSSLQKQVEDSHLKEKETEKATALLEIKLKELEEELCLLSEDNGRLSDQLVRKDEDLGKLSEEWELLSCEMEEMLLNGQLALDDAADQLHLISSSFPQKRIWISEQVGRLIRTISEKELLIEALGKLLEDANVKRNEVEYMVNSLRGAALVINEANHQECIKKDDEILLLKSQLNAKASIIVELEEKVKHAEHKLEEIDTNNISEIREKFAELRAGICSFRSFMDIPFKNDTIATNDEMQASLLPDDGNNQQTDAREDLIADIAVHCLRAENGLCSSSTIQKDRGLSACKHVAHRDVSVILLKKEIESAINSLREVHLEMNKLQKKKVETQMFEKKHLQGMDHFITQMLDLQTAISNFEEHVEVKIYTINNKLKTFEQTVEETETFWCQMKECLEMEACDSKIAAVQKAAEASCIFAKFEEAQHTMKDADIMINELLIANEMMKLDVEKLKEKENSLANERKELTVEVERLQAINVIKDKQLEEVKVQFGLDLMETRDLVMELEEIIAEVQVTFKENLSSFASDFDCLKTLVSNDGKLMHSWLEDVWSDIIVKDCALSVLHLCHMGIFLETITGLNAENGFLQHGLCESNSIISDLREHNSKSSKELQICRTLKGKLLADIKNSFDRIARKEEETGKLDVKLITFEKKISDLQFQEELMLQRSNYMGSQLAGLMKELDLSNRNVAVSLFDQEKMLKDKDELLHSQEELFMLEMCSKDIELFVITSQLDEMAHQNVLAERERDYCGSYLESLKKELIMSKVDAELKEHELVAKKTECDKLLKDLKTKDASLEESAGHVSLIDRENVKLQKHVQQLQISSRKIQNDLDMKNAEIGKISCLEEENKLLKSDLLKLKNERCLVFQDLEMKNSEVESFLCRIDMSDAENQRLQGRISSLETLVSSLQAELEMKNAELDELVHSQTVVMADISTKSQDLENFVGQLNRLKDENELLRKDIHKIHTKSSLNAVKCVDSLQMADGITDRLVAVLKEKHLSVSEMYYAFCESVERTSEFVKEIECLERHVVELAAENNSLHAELLRKDDILKGLLFDLSLLQESASSTKDQKDKIEEMMGNMEALEDELSMKSSELEEAFSHQQILEAQLQDKIDIISALEMDYAKMCASLKIYSEENLDMKAQIEEALAAKASLEEELTEKKNLADSLEIQLSQLQITLCQMNNTTESLRSDLDSITTEREQFQMEIHSLKDQLKKAQAWAEENEAIALESQQEAESRKNYAEDKETEVKLLEKSVEELECTVNVLENKVDILKDEAERQRLQREELEMELHAVNHQMQNVKSSDFDMNRYLEQKEKDLEHAMERIQFLERDIAEKNKEISQCKAHISELNLHAEAQASEFKQKFKALEAMAEQANPENQLSHIANPSWNKSDKVYAKPRGSNSPFDKSDKAYVKPRGSGSPFKCIGLGLAQQMKSEKDEEFAAARMRIEELESLAASRQKEIFALNARLAAAESMTHDVIRDLLGVKLDMTNCVQTILDHHQVQKIAEKVQLGTLEPQVKDQEVNKLRQQLNEFIEERHVWLEEIDRKQAELVAAQVALEKLLQREQLLSAENEILKMENINHKKRVMELEGEVKKLSGQQNLQQRIHHHAKIKDENNSLKSQNEDLTAKLHRTEVIILRMKDELARYRAANGRGPSINFDEEQRLVNKLKESEEDRMQLAQKLLGLCTSILKVAGITKPISTVTPAVAEKALEQLKNRIASLERELQDAIYKDRINAERIRLSELLPQTSPRNSRQDDNCRTPRRSQSPFFSALDR